MNAASERETAGASFGSAATELVGRQARVCEQQESIHGTYFRITEIIVELLMLAVSLSLWP